jgi:alpha-galactosidase
MSPRPHTVLFAGALLLTAPLVAHAQEANTVWLDSLDATKMTSGWQKSRTNLSIDGNPLKLKGTLYPHGLGTHAESNFTIAINGATKFSALVGVDDEVTGRGSIKFMLYLDGKLAYESAEMHGGDQPNLLMLDLTGAKKLTLHVDDVDGDITFDHADWADAKFTVPAGAVAPIALPAEAPPGGVSSEPPVIASYAKEKPAPAINGARVTGTTPGRPFLFKIPATGQEPLTFSAKGLPAGLTLDEKTGIITGSVRKSGKSVVRVTVSNTLGAAQRNLVIVAGEHKLAQTPPMGWNSWNAYYTNVDEKKMRDAVEWIRKTGLDKHGYEYVNIDDAWEANRDAEGEILVNQKFSSMKALGDYIHGYGLKFGIYSSPGPKTCGGYEGSFKHEQQDANTYASWGVDYLKYDWCSYQKTQEATEREAYKLPYKVMRTALDNANRDIVYSLCQYGMNNVWEWGADKDVAGNLWRTTGDIAPSYNSMANIGFKQNGLEKYAGPGHWNDPDMLFVHAMKPNEQITHLTLWSLLAAPLLIGSDISRLDQFTIDALSNDEVIAVDQDPLGRQGTRRSQEGSLEVWARPLWDGTIAVGLFNRSKAPAPVTARWADLGLKGSQPVRDLWKQQDLGAVKDTFTATVPGHGAVLVKIGKPNAGDYSGK